jgi:hypothetical protein
VALAVNGAIVMPRVENPMASRQHFFPFLVYGFLVFGVQGQAYSDELKIFTSRAVATVLEKSVPNLKRTRDIS